MANNIYWGQGANMNVLYWGQGAATSTKGWGYSHGVSWSDETDLFGLGGYLSSSLYTRAISEGAQFEATQCLQTTLISLDI